MHATEQKITALRRAAQSSPEYAEIVPLFSAIYEYLQGREHLTGIAIGQDSDRKELTGNSFPLISVTDLHVDREQATVFLLGIIAVLSRKGKEHTDYLSQIATALQEGTIDPASLYGAILERRRVPINDLSEHLSIPSPLIEYIFEISLKTALEGFAADCEAAQFAGWQEPVCPVCGSRPGMAELSGEEGRRTLSCSACSFMWPFKRLACAYCGSENPEKLSYFTVEEGATRVDTCRGCSRYIKTRDSRKAESDVPLEVEDLLTLHLDLLAAKEGFERGK
ncbi:MAG: formate dehydrogenase accessory protein FdhE [Desulfuromonadaceae bacterium]